MKITFEAEIAEDHGDSFVVMLKTGFGEPKVIVHKEAVKVEDNFKCFCGAGFSHKDAGGCAAAMQNCYPSGVRL